MSTPKMSWRPLTLQARLMAAVIGFVSLIFVIVAMITSATLGASLQAQLNQQLRDASNVTSSAVSKAAKESAFFRVPLTLESISESISVQGQGVLVVVAAPDSTPLGMIKHANGQAQLTSAQLESISDVAAAPESSTVRIPKVGSYQVTVTHLDNGISVITGLSRDGVQRTLTELFTVIALATIGGLILLALTTAITIRLSLRPLRAVAATATRVANRPLDRGEVTITERVPASESDPRTETGLVGAALNTLLDHVDASLTARQRNEERMRQFVADASHELRTPLASIRGYSELSLRDRTLPENTQTALERIQAQSLRMTRLVEDLLLLARLDEGTELVHGTVDLTQLIVEGVADARPISPDHLWTVVVPDEPVVVLGDAGRLHQVVTNLIANAHNHTPAGTAVTASVMRDGTDAVVRVTDNGPGIDPAVREELFARFARGDTSRARQTGGTGLGLAIVKAIVEGHGGTITVRSEPGNTEFEVRLPQSRAHEGGASPEPRQPEDQ